MMTTKDEKYIYISTQDDLDYLIMRINDGPMFANELKFTDRSYFISLLETLGVDFEEFIKCYYYYDRNRHLHLSESEFNYVWISTYGLIPKDKSTTNKEVNACANQHTTLSLLLDKAIELSEDEKVYNVDSYSFGELSVLSPALFHNILFYIEVFCKAYISLCGIKTPHIHKLSDIYAKLIEIMYNNEHNDSILQVRIIEPLAKFINHVNTLPANFKEQFVKYDDNPDDNTIIIFDPGSLYEFKGIIELSIDFILDYFYRGIETHYIKPGFYQKLIDKAKNEDEKKKVDIMYGHLKSKDKLK